MRKRSIVPLVAKRCTPNSRPILVQTVPWSATSLQNSPIKSDKEKRRLQDRITLFHPRSSLYQLDDPAKPLRQTTIRWQGEDTTQKRHGGWRTYSCSMRTASGSQAPRSTPAKARLAKWYTEWNDRFGRQDTAREECVKLAYRYAKLNTKL